MKSVGQKKVKNASRKVVVVELHTADVCQSILASSFLSFPLFLNWRPRIESYTTKLTKHIKQSWASYQYGWWPSLIIIRTANNSQYDNIDDKTYLTYGIACLLLIPERRVFEPRGNRKGGEIFSRHRWPFVVCLFLLLLNGEKGLFSALFAFFYFCFCTSGPR